MIFFEIRSVLGDKRSSVQAIDGFLIIRSNFFCWACHKYMEQLAINCKFFYISIISTNNLQCRFFMVQLTLIYYLYVLLLCILCVLHVFYYFNFRAVVSVMHWPFCPPFSSSSYHVFYFVQINMDGWMDVRPSVCPSHIGILSKRLYISSKFFHLRVAPPF